MLYPGKLRGIVLLPLSLSIRLRVYQQTKANTHAIESLAPRVKALAESLCEPVPKVDVKEGARRRRLEQ